jgi:hypothetical protein
MKSFQNEARKQKSIIEVTLQFSVIFQIGLKNNTVKFVNFRVIWWYAVQAFYLAVQVLELLEKYLNWKSGSRDALERFMTTSLK